ncbi:helix-turn-helix domain-containing protein [Halodesulfurarchaeum formicicum]|uniref:TrmB family transcriptional regulator n=1 Tax=Halodesulfurarchaeum formicicum TaxID=1873524 RepID=A0A1J1AA32_9EURY|nr:helix-turn-helix domain-containing protein [Halodesulfurarchaeum formicicum]APE94648.1 TrmB family transcriptional regulator [Halodesulfurarchaeum formicicum]
MTTPAAQVFECESCANTLVAVHRPDELRCCGEAMTPVHPEEPIIEPPDLETLWREIFGLSRTRILVCICVLMDEPTTVAEVAELSDLSESTVSNHLDPLVAAGILERSVRNLRAGGTIHVYRGASIETQQAIYRRGLFTWFARAISMIDAYSPDQLKAPYTAVAETETQQAQAAVFWD